MSPKLDLQLIVDSSTSIGDEKFREMMTVTIEHLNFDNIFDNTTFDDNDGNNNDNSIM